MSLLFYFKIPDIGYKWIEKTKKEINKWSTKNKESHNSKEIDVKYELNEILKKIIAILYDLINNIKEKVK